MVRMAAAYRVPEDEIVQAIINPTSGQPISPVTLRKHFREELDQGYVNGKMRVMAATFQSATGVKNAAGEYVLNPNVTAQIWLSKTLYGMRENVAVEVPPAARLGEDAEGITLESARRVAFALSLGAEIADRKPAPKAKKA